MKSEFLQDVYRRLQAVVIPLKQFFLDEYLQQKSVPGGTQRNWDSYGSKIGSLTDFQKSILADPQTSGGLLVSIDEVKQVEFEAFLSKKGISLKPFGKFIKSGSKAIYVS